MKFNGTKLRELREAKGWSQTDLAKETKTSRVSISQWESCTHEPSLEVIGKLGAAFGINGVKFFVDQGVNKFEFTSLAKPAKGQDTFEVGVWTDGIGVYSDNDVLCAYKLHKGKNYRVTIEEAP